MPCLGRVEAGQVREVLEGRRLEAGALGQLREEHEDLSTKLIFVYYLQSDKVPFLNTRQASNARLEPHHSRSVWTLHSSWERRMCVKGRESGG